MLRRVHIGYSGRRLEASELDEELRLAWATFLEFEARDYTREGVDAFRRNTIDNAEFRDKCARGENQIWGAFNGNVLAGMMCLRAPCHICMAFTHHWYLRKGVGTALFKRLLCDVRREYPDARRITVNSSPYGKPFYNHTGFIDTDAQQSVNGILFTPMEYLL